MTLIEELDAELTQHFLTMLQTKKPIAGVTLAVIAAHLKGRDKRPRRTTLFPSEQPQVELPFPGEEPVITASDPRRVAFVEPLKLPFPGEE